MSAIGTTYVHTYIPGFYVQLLIEIHTNFCTTKISQNPIKYAQAKISRSLICDSGGLVHFNWCTFNFSCLLNFMVVCSVTNILIIRYYYILKWPTTLN